MPDFVCPFTKVASSETSGPYRKSELAVDIIEDTVDSPKYGQVGIPMEFIKPDAHSRVEEKFPSSGLASDDSSADSTSSEDESAPPGRHPEERPKRARLLDTHLLQGIFLYNKHRDRLHAAISCNEKHPEARPFVDDAGLTRYVRAPCGNGGDNCAVTDSSDQGTPCNRNGCQSLL